MPCAQDTYGYSQESGGGGGCSFAAPVSVAAYSCRRRTVGAGREGYQATAAGADGTLENQYHVACVTAVHMK